jgi:hypothetical protein
MKKRITTLILALSLLLTLTACGGGGNDPEPEPRRDRDTTQAPMTTTEPPVTADPDPDPDNTGEPTTTEEPEPDPEPEVDPLAGFEWKESDRRNWGGYVITKYTGDDTHVIIPDTIDGLPVTEIAKNIFRGNTAIESVYIPDTVRQIWDEVFKDCTNLKEVRLSENLVFIGSRAFNNTSLTSIELPDSLLQINNDVFTYTGITHVVLPDGLRVLLNTGIAQGNQTGFVFHDDVIVTWNGEDYIYNDGGNRGGAGQHNTTAGFFAAFQAAGNSVGGNFDTDSRNGVQGEVYQTMDNLKEESRNAIAALNAD